MAEFSFFRHDRYPGVNLQIEIHPTISGSRTSAKVELFAEGDVGTRASLVDDMKRWKARHDLTAVVAREVLSCCYYEFDLTGWNVVTDFIIEWVGVDALSETFRDREFLEHRIFGEVRALSFKVEALTTQISRLQETVLSSAVSCAAG